MAAKAKQNAAGDYVRPAEVHAALKESDEHPQKARDRQIVIKEYIAELESVASNALRDLIEFKEQAKADFIAAKDLFIKETTTLSVKPESAEKKLAKIKGEVS